MDRLPPLRRGGGTTAAALVCVALTAAACGNERERDLPASCTSWFPDVQPVVAASCAGCHGGEQPAGDYDLSSYLGALGNGTDEVPNAVAGDASSRILTTLTDAPSEPHGGFDELAALLDAWVVECELSHRRSRIHEGGILNPVDADFHGRLVADLGYDFDACAECHGVDFTGGTADASCVSCHADGPTDCTTCHGDLAERGAHRVHAGDGLDLARCAPCHAVPDDYRDAGHIFAADGTIDPAPAEVALTGLAAATPEGTTRTGPPAFDSDTRTCSQVYCHGAVLGDGAATLTSPRWNDGPDAAACGTCHGAPPADHADDRCSVCHAAVIDAAGEFVAPQRHVDGVFDAGEGCTGCHGGGTAGAAPPPDLLGRSDPELVTVGAHRAHVLALSRLRGPIPCSDCHATPSAIDSPGHIDTAAPAEVFPVGFGGLAAADGAVPVWDRDTATCADVYCHGGGDTLSTDPAPEILREPVWTALAQGKDACGRCHGIPPATGGPHAGDLTLFDCASCHPSVTSSGLPILTGPPGDETSLHMNGVVDVQ